MREITSLGPQSLSICMNNKVKLLQNLTFNKKEKKSIIKDVIKNHKGKSKVFTTQLDAIQGDRDKLNDRVFLLLYLNNLYYDHWIHF